MFFTREKLKVDDIALFNEEVMKSLEWPSARMSEIIPRKDGIVRMVNLSTKNGLYVRHFLQIFRKIINVFEYMPKVIYQV